MACVQEVNVASQLVVQSALNGATGYLGARLFTSINPMHGGAFGLLSFLISKVTEPIFDGIFQQQGATNATKMLGYVLHVTATIGLTIAACSVLGFSMTLSTAAILIISQIAAWILGSIVLDCCGCAVAGSSAG